MTTIFAAMRNALCIARAEVDTWQVSNRMVGYDLECVAVASGHPQRVFCGTFDSGLFRSQDGGDTFERVETDVVTSDTMTALSINPHDPEEVIVGTEPSALYRSSNGGDSWRPVHGIEELPSEPEWSFPPRPHTHHVRWIEIDHTDPNRIYVGIEAGALVYSDDGGETWRDRPPGARRDNHSIVSHPTVTGRVYSAAGDGYAESYDYGESWEHPQDGLDHRYVWSVVVDPADPETVLVSSAKGAGGAHRLTTADSYVYRRTAGEAWERLDARGIPTGKGILRAVLASGKTGGAFYAVNNRGIFYTTNGGDRWNPLKIEWPEPFEEQTPRGLVVVE